MADSRLRWNQLTAPDLSAASAAVARANTSFNAGFDTGADIISQYGSAQQAKADDEILAEIAGLADENAFDAFIDSGSLAGRNISPEMREHILGLRGGLVDIQQGRSNIRSTDASTANTRATMGINLARESRTASDWRDGISSRDAARALAGQGVAAQEFASQYGNTVGGIQEQNGVQSQVYQGLLSRGLPEHVAQGFMMNFQDESGFDIDVTEAEANVHGTRGRGLYQLTGARRAAFEARYGNDYSIDNQLDWLMEELGGSESAAAQAILNTTNAGQAGAEIVTRFLRPAEEHRMDRVGRYTQGEYTPPQAGTTQTIERQTPVQEYRTALVESGQFTLPQIDEMMRSITSAGDDRESEILAEREASAAQAEAERRANAILQVTANPETVTAVDAGAELLSDTSLPATERLGDLAALETAVATSPAISNILAPEVESDPRVEGITDGIAADLNNAAQSTPQARMIGSIPDYAEDPAGTLISELNLGGDDQEPMFGGDSEFDSNRVTQLINEYAQQFEVTDEVAAVAMREAFVRDPTTILGIYNRNTLENRFPEREVGRIIEETLSQESISGYRADSNRREQVLSQINQINSQITQLQQQAAKGGDRTAISQEIANLMVQMSQIRSENASLFGTPAQE